MATTLSYPVSAFLPFTKIVSSDMNSQLTAIQNRINWGGSTDATTGLGDDNIQSNTASGGGLTRATKLKKGTANYAVYNDGTGAMTEASSLPITSGGLGFLPSLSGNAGQAVIVNNGESGFQLGSPIQTTLSQSLASDVSSLTAGEAITANAAVCLDLHYDGSGNNIYRVFNADYTLPRRRNSFIGLAISGATVTAGIYTWVASANFVASNSIAFSINNRPYTVAFTTNNATTLQAVATAMATDPDVNGAVSDGSHTVTVTGKGGLFINITGSVVTGGASQATITVTNTQAPSGQNVKIRCFGDLTGQTSLTPGANYYLDTAGATTTAPADTNPVLIGQALSSTVIFVNRNVGQFQFTTPEIFVRSHGSTTDSDSTATAISEHFNFSSWSSGTSDGTSLTRTTTGPGILGSLFYVVAGDASGATFQNINRIYNKTSWSAGTAAGTGFQSRAVYALSTNLIVAGGNVAGPSQSNRIDKYNGSTWTTSVAALTSASSAIAPFLYQSLIHYCGGNSTSTNHDTFNGTSKSTATAVPTGGNYCSGSVSPSSKGIIWGKESSATNSYEWSGSWSSSLPVTATYYTTDNHLGGASGYSSGNNATWGNGGSTGSSAPINTTTKYNGTSWGTSTVSSSSRMGSAGGVF